MKIVTPDYYKNFKCIAGECTDTCCAGWDVDVDKESYKQYRRVIGSFGNKLRSVMVPSEDGGCTFTLKEGRCPFLIRRICVRFISSLVRIRCVKRVQSFPDLLMNMAIQGRLELHHPVRQQVSLY